MKRSALFALALPVAVVAIGLLVAAAFSWRGAPAPLPDVELMVTGTGAAFPTAAVDPSDGTAFVAWAAKADSAADVHLVRLELGAAAFSAPVRVNDRAGDAAVHPQAPARVAAGPAGAVYVAWVRTVPVAGRRFPASDVRLARSTDGGRTFAPATTVNRDPGVPAGHHFHDLAVGPDGTVYVSWLDSGARERAMHAAPAPSASPAHAHGHARDGLPGTALHVATSTDGGVSFTEVVVAQGTCQCCRTSLAVGDDGTVYVAWRHLFDDGARDMAVARSLDAGRTFSAPVRAHRDGWRIDGCPHAGPALAVGRRGDVHLAWYTGLDGGAGVYHAVSRDGGASFGPPSVLAADVPVSQVAAADDAGRVWLAWEDHAERGFRFGPEAAFARPETAPRFDGASPAVAAGPGARVLAWRAGTDLRVRVERAVL